MINNILFYGKNKNRTNKIIEFSFKNIDKNILIIDIEEDIDKLYPLTLLNSVDTILLNPIKTDIFYHLDMIEQMDTIIINGFSRIEDWEDTYKDELISILSKLNKDGEIEIIIFSENKIKEFPKNIKVEKNKIKNIEKKIFKINKNMDLNIDDIKFIKRKRIKVIEDKSI